MGDGRSTGNDSAVVTDTESLVAHAYTVHTSTCAVTHRKLYRYAMHRLRMLPDAVNYVLIAEDF